MKIPQIQLDSNGNVANMGLINNWAIANNIAFRSIVEKGIAGNLDPVEYRNLMIATLLHCNEALLDTMHFQMTSSARTDHHRETAMKNYLKEKAAKEQLLALKQLPPHQADLPMD